MNKKFSTLMASVLLASAFSTSAYAAITPGVDAKVKEGDYVRLVATENNAIVINTDNTLKEELQSSATTIAGIHAQLWQVASVKYNEKTGIPVYQFINKVTGQYLAVNLVTDKNGESTAKAKLNASGNKDWTLEGGKLAVFANDSTYTITTGFKLAAEKGNKIPASPLTLEVKRDAAGSVTLDAAKLNDLLVDGKLYFNDEDVSEGNDNILTANPWKAYAEKGTPASKFFLMRADKDSVTSDNKNPYLLMVDTAMYAGGDYHKLVIDTLAISKDDAAKMKDKDALYQASAYAPTIAGAARQINAAIFSANYTLYNDSIGLVVDKTPTKNKYLSTITDYTSTYGAEATATANANAAITANASEVLKRMVGYSEAIVVTDAAPIKTLATAVLKWELQAIAASASRTASAFDLKFSGTKFDTNGTVAAGGKVANATDAENPANEGVLTKAQQWLESAAGKAHAKKDLFAAFVAAAGKLERLTGIDAANSYYHMVGYAHTASTAANSSALVLKQLANTKVLTVTSPMASINTGAIEAAGYAAPLIQPYATTGGDAVIEGTGKVYFLQLAAATESVPTLRAGIAADKYLVVNPLTGVAEDAETVDAANVYAQWAFIQGATGSYQVVNRGTGKILYSGPVSKGEEADTYVIGGNTYKLANVDLSDAAIYDEKGTKYDYTGAFYAGPADGVSQSFAIAPASQYLTSLNVQFNKDSVLVLGDAATAPQWYLKAGTPATYGFSVPGLPDLKKVTYQIYTKDAEDGTYYVYPKIVSGKTVFAITKSDSKDAANASKFEFSTVGKDTYLLLVPADPATSSKMATINLNLAEPTIESSSYTTEGQDYFTILKSEYSDYRTLTAEDGVDGNAKIFMENEPSRYLYENTANIVANNGNGIAKDSLNFLGVFNADAMVKNAALYIDTAYVDRKDNTKPLYMIALGVEKVAATEGTACTESGKHFDANGKETTADKCVHATPGTEGYKTGRYLVSLKDSVPTGFAKHPAIYDNCVRLAFVDATHIADTLIISDSKFTGTKNAVNDSIKINATPNKATFALKIVDQATQSFVMETVGGNTYVRILNGVPVLTGDIKEAAVFNIEATEENATANEAIAAEGVQVIGGKGAVTVQGAAGKVITVANVLGQTIANQVAASDNVTIAAPAGIVVVAVEGDATKVVVK